MREASGQVNIGDKDASLKLGVEDKAEEIGLKAQSGESPCCIQWDQVIQDLRVTE